MLITLSPNQSLICYTLNVICFFIYNVLLFKLAGNFLNQPKLKHAQLIPVCLFNTILLMYSLTIKESMTLVLYCSLIMLFTFEFFLLHKERFLRVYFVVLACVIHVVIVRGVVISLMALIYKTSVYQISNQLVPLLVSTLISCGILNILILAVLKLIPAENMKILNQHAEQLNFMCACLSVIMFYFLVNSLVYHVDTSYPLLNILQLVSPIVMLAVAYITLLYSFKTANLLGYKEINSELKTEIFKEQQYRNSILTNSLAIYEFNVTKNQVISGFNEIAKDINKRDWLTLDKIVELTAKKIVHPDDQKIFIHAFDITHFRKEMERGNHEVTMDYRRRNDFGEWVWVRSVINLMQNIKDEIEGCMYVKDIDLLKKEELELKFRAERDLLTKLNNKESTEELISAYLNNHNQGKPCGTLFIIDIDNFKTVNDGLGHLYGDQVLQEISGKLRSLFRDNDIVGRIGGDEFMAFMKGSHHKEAIQNRAETICQCFHCTYKSVEGNSYTISASVGISVAPVHGETFEELYRTADIAAYSSKNRGKNTYTIYEGEEFREYKANRREMDELIGGISFFQFKEDASNILKNREKQNYLFVRIDMNDFQMIKGLHGFNTGDEILRDIGKAIKATINDCDIYARMASDNFVVLTTYEDETDIYSQGARFKENFKRIHDSIDKNYQVTFKIGFSRIEEDEQDIEQIIILANQAHELAKKQNKAMYSYNETLKCNKEMMEMIEENMAVALDRQEFHVYLQPRYSLKDSKMVGGEAFACWLRDNQIYIKNEVFMPVFERTQFITKIDLFIIRQACELIKKMVELGKEPLMISLKQTSQSILSPSYLEAIKLIVKDTKINPQWIELEISENTIYEDKEVTLRVIHVLKDMGFNIAIDEFGNGSSSMTLLNEMPCDAIKIDSTILYLAIENVEYSELLRSILHQANYYHMRVITERVETNQQIAMLLELNDAITQGYLYTKPITMKEFLAQ